MVRYTGNLSKSTETLIKNNIRQFIGLIRPKAKPTHKRRKGLGDIPSNSLLISLEESIEKYNAGITEDEIKAWVWHRKNQGIPMLSWSKYFVKNDEKTIFDFVTKGVLYFDGTSQSLVPFPVFVFGNLYEKIAKTKSNQDEIVQKYGASVYQNHISILEASKPKPLSIQNPVESERPVILAISGFTDTCMLESLREDSGVLLVVPDTLRECFCKWLRVQPDKAFNKTKAFEIIYYYIYGTSKPRDIEKIEWDQIKKNTRDEGERLFKIFLHKALEVTDQLRIDADYNSKYNCIAPLQFNKIPVNIQVSRKFRGFDLNIAPAQREGVAFMDLVGSGITAYDVGVGKTITAIIEVVTAINNGKCKRPIIAVPNPTYKNWIKEMEGEDGLEGILTGTGIVVNKWFNLGSEYDHNKLDKKLPEKSITLVSYEGLQKLGFNEFTQAGHFEELSSILEQKTSGKSARDMEKGNEKLREIIGVGLKETIADIETLGFDYIVVDEAHNFKNIFSEVKSDDDNKKQFQIQGGQPSNRGIKLFFICNYIQRKYGRNVMLLTATPFTNSPLEIYSMLSLVAYEYMKSWSIYNIKHFFEQYIQETTEYVVGVDGEIKQKNVVKSFNNRISLQKLINSHINFKTGEEANIPRPCKINLPKTSEKTNTGVKRLKAEEQVLTYLKLNDIQYENQLEINSEASAGANKDDPGKLLRLMSQSLNNALSPFLYDKSTPLDYKDFVNNSPKIQYTLDCVQSVKEWHEARNQPVSGQVIYIDRGKEYFQYIKEYLETVVGYKKGIPLKSNPKLKVDEVEIITGEISTTNKEKIKDAFNEGTCKIIIGTSTIKEGINLQEKSTVLYNLYPNWNPTDIRQLEGRIWRQKNENGYVRIVLPLMENSMDVFVFQKLEEKTSRINDLWSKSDRGNVLDEESLDPNEVKFALVTDLGVLQRFELKQITEGILNKIAVLNGNINDLKTYSDLKARYEGTKDVIKGSLRQALTSLPNLVLFTTHTARVYFKDIATLKLDELTIEHQNIVERIKRVYDSLCEANQSDSDKDMILALAQYCRFVNYQNSALERFKNYVSEFAKIKRTIFEQRGYGENESLDVIRIGMDKELEEVAAELAETKTETFREKVMEDIIIKKEKLSIKGGGLKDRVNEFKSINYLLSYKFKDIDHTSCTIPTKENDKPISTGDDDAKAKRIRIVKAKAQALRLKLMLLEV